MVLILPMSSANDKLVASSWLLLAALACLENITMQMLAARCIQTEQWQVLRPQRSNIEAHTKKIHGPEAPLV